MKIMVEVSLPVLFWFLFMLVGVAFDLHKIHSPVRSTLVLHRSGLE